MGTLAALAPILGLFAGAFIAKYTKQEVKQGKKYFILLQHLVLAGIASTILWNIDKIQAIAVGILLFAVLWKTKFSHPIELTPILAAPAVLSTTAQIPIFLYFIPTGTLNKERLTHVAAIYAVIAITASLTF